MQAASTMSMAGAGQPAPVSIARSKWDKWPPEDREAYTEMEKLGVLGEFWSPDEELKSKKGKEVRRRLRNGRHDHNQGVIDREHARLAVAAQEQRAAEAEAARLAEEDAARQAEVERRAALLPRFLPSSQRDAALCLWHTCCKET